MSDVLARAFPGWLDAAELTPDECANHLPYQWPSSDRPPPAEVGQSSDWWRHMYEGWAE